MSDDLVGLKWNMYGHTVCPKCKNAHRFMRVAHPDVVYCDDCGHREPATRENSNEHSAASFNKEE